MAHDHHHEHHHHHQHELSSLNKAFIIGIGLNVAFVVVEFVAGFWYNSLGLISDAGHNLGDVASLVLAMLAFRLAKVHANTKYTYGYKKSTVLVSLLNAVILLVAVGFIFGESVEKLFHPRPVDGDAVAWVAGAGVLVNAFTAWLFLKDKEKDLNVESMFTAVTLGAKEQQYHCDGGEVKTYSAADVVVLYAAYKNYVTKHTTYCNLLKTWIKRETDKAVIGAIRYGDTLPDDLTAQMQNILNAATAQLTSITAAVSDGAFADKISSLEKQMTETQMALCDVYEQVITVTSATEG